MRITFVNQKGGAGKTTTALLLGSVLVRAGYDVALDDHDAQRSGSFFAQQFGLPIFDEQQPSQYVLTDTPGHLDQLEGQYAEDIKALIAQSDVVLLVTGKDPADIHGSAAMAHLISDNKPESTKAYVLFTKVRLSTSVGKQDGEAIATDLGLPALRNELPLASAYVNAHVDGLSAVTGRHRTELLDLALEVMK